MNVRRTIALLGVVGAPVLVAALLLGVAGTPEAYGAVDPYWKESWDDYAPSGLPDFDQKQDAWGNGLQWTYCGPVAAANSLWWYDSSFETDPHPPFPEPGDDGYPLVQAYGPWDDHWFENVMPFVDDLATNYFGTQPDTGTNVYDMYYGMQRYLYDQGLYDDYLVTLAISPTMEWVIEEVLRSEDVILLLGMWEWVDPDGTPGTGDEYAQRIGGHYVTVAGLELSDPQMPLIALSDPFMDMAEQGWPGRVGTGILLPHDPEHGPLEHNDAGNVSHDYYIMAQPSPTPGGVWGLADYPPPPDAFLWADNFAGVNAHPNFTDGPYMGGPIFSEVEFAIAMSPFFWKRGEWIDYAPSCMPDFSQIQDAWGPNPFAPPWTYCGPVAVANSLWWFDSKFEPNPVPPPAPNDNYPLVLSYGPWDDHDPLNVETQGPSSEFVDDLASLMGPIPLASGTIITDLVNGTRDYLAIHGLIDDYTVTQVHEPEWEWVMEEVLRSEDVVLLLGFWLYDPSGVWYRMGGHYVTVAGVDPVADLVGFADPYFDQAELGWPWLGRTFPPGHPPHAGLIPDMVHNDAAFLSHDVYHADPSPSPGGLWGPREYPAAAGMMNFEGQNGPSFVPVPGPPPLDPSKLYTEVEWAMAVSPKPPDLVISKTVTPTRPLLPGEWLTYTFAFTNVATPWTYDVVITDLVPAELIDDHLACLTTFGTPITVSDRYVLEVGRLGYMAGGMCTIAARIDPGITDTTRSIVNEVKIHTVTAERDNTNNGAAVKTTVHTADVWAGKEGPAKTVAGDPLTYTLSYGNYGPADAENVGLVDLFPDGASYVGDDSGLSGAAVTGGRRWGVGPLASSSSATFVLTLSLPVGTAAENVVTNTLSINTTTPESKSANNRATVTTTVQTADVWVTKEVPEKTMAGDPLTYTLSYGNYGPADAENVALVDLFPDGASYVNDDSGLSGTPVARGRSWHVGPLASSGSATFVLTLSLPVGTAAQEVVTNTLSISTTTPENQSANNRAAVTTTVQTADVWVTKEGPEKTVTGDPLTYTLGYGNDGPADAEYVVLDDLFPDGASYVGDDSGLPGSPVAGGRSWGVGPLASSSSATFVLTLSLPSDTPTGILVTNTIGIATTTPESELGNNEAQVESKVYGRVYLPLVLRAYVP